MRKRAVIVKGGVGDQWTRKEKTRNDRNISDSCEDDVKFVLMSRMWTGSRSSWSSAFRTVHSLITRSAGGYTAKIIGGVLRGIEGRRKGARGDGEPRGLSAQ